MYFSLAYEKRINKRLLNFISLCDLGLKAPKEALLLFEFYLDNYKINAIDKDFEEILHSVELKNKEETVEEISDSNSMNYKDFLKSEEKLGFKKSFENVIFNGKLIISNKEDFLEFLEKLLENGYKEVVLTYLEDISPYFWENQRFFRLQKKLMEQK